MLDYKSGWRPTAGWAFILITSAITGVCVFAVIEEWASIEQCSGIFIAIVASYAPVVATYVHGRTKEKLEGKHDPVSTEPDWETGDSDNGFSPGGHMGPAPLHPGGG